MGCCGSTELENLNEHQRRGVYDVCATAILAPKPRALVEFAVEIHKKMGKDPNEIYTALRTEDRKLGMYAQKPAELDPNKSMSQLMDHTEKQARMFTQKKFGDEFKKDKKLGIDSDEDLKLFVQKAVKECMQHAVMERINEMYEPSSPEDDLKSSPSGIAQSSSTSGDLRKEKSGNSTTTSSSSSKPKTTTDSREPTSSSSSGSKAQQQNKQQQQKSSSSTTSSSSTKKKEYSYARAKPPVVTAPQGDPPAHRGPRVADNKWEACDDSDYYYNGYLYAYYDPVTKKYFNFDTEVWTSAAPKLP